MSSRTSRLFLPVLILIAFSGILYAQEIPSRAVELRNRFSVFTYADNFDSAQALVVHFLDNTDLSDTEKFFGHYFFADIVKSSGKPGEAIPLLQRSSDLLGRIADSHTYQSLVDGNIAECYFTMLDYPKAKEYALKSIRESPGKNLRSGGHAVNHLIIGYCDFLSKDNSSALAHYEEAVKQYLLAGEKCELPLCYMKMASVFDASGEHSRAEAYMSKAVSLSDSCNIDEYRLLSMRGLLEMYQRNGNYHKALDQLLLINDMVERISRKKQDKAMNELTVKYQTKMIEDENETLRQLNLTNTKLLKEQRRLLIVSVGGFVLTLSLFFFVTIFYRQKKKAERELRKLNADLEIIVNDRTAHLVEANDRISQNTNVLTMQNRQLIDFCNIVSHNLRSPVSNLGTLLTMIEDSKSEAERELILGKFRPVVRNLNSTFEQLLESLKVKQDVDIRSEEISFDEVLKQTKEILQTEIEESGARITSDFSEAPYVLFPPKYLHSIIHNLVSNAIKYRSPERDCNIRLHTERRNGRTILSVSDNGLGIDLVKYGKDLFRINKVFHVHPEARGFGLYLTKTQIETMNGSIRAESEVGKGTTFIVEFPAQQV